MMGRIERGALALLLGAMLGAAPGWASPGAGLKAEAGQKPQVAHKPEAGQRPASGLVDLNRATVEELQGLPGIGPRKAASIVELRHKRPFTRVTQLLEIKGIGKKTLERLKAHVRVVGASGPQPPRAEAGAGRRDGGSGEGREVK